MTLKKLISGVFCVFLLACGTGPVEAEYRADEFLSLDLSKALLSPAPLGPASEFMPYPVEARADRGDERTLARSKPQALPRTAVTAIKPHSPGRSLLARRHGNPLDAQASDRRIQVWPCKSGGICDWHH